MPYKKSNCWSMRKKRSFGKYGLIQIFLDFFRIDNKTNRYQYITETKYMVDAYNKRGTVFNCKLPNRLNFI